MSVGLGGGVGSRPEIIPMATLRIDLVRYFSPCLLDTSPHPPMNSVRYLGYNSLKDFFPTMDIKPNPACINPLCCK